MASLSAYAITLGSTDYPVKYAGLLSYVEPYLTNLESFTFSAGNVGLAGNFTLGAASDLTLNKGTANGVLYLNGSKVATSGSALVFDGGNLVVGNTAANERLEIYKGVAYNSDPALYFRIGSIDTAVNNNTPHTWRTGITGSAAGYNYVFQTLARAESSWVERARITSGGDLLVGTTSAGGQSGFAVLKGAGGIETSIQIAHNFGTASGVKYADFLYATSSIGSITQSGTTGVLYNTTSDQRLKTNVVDAPDAAALIDAIKVRSFDWISDDSHQRYGMVAQELAAVAPEAVHAPADPAEMMAVDYSKLVPMLIKEIQSLRARVAALEGV